MMNTRQKTRYQLNFNPSLAAAGSLKRIRWEGIVTVVSILGLTLFVFWILHPNEIFSGTTATGGDTSAHIWGPDFLKEHLLPSLSGWTHDWFGGLPAFTFYPVVPNLVIALLSYVISDNVAFKVGTAGTLVFFPLVSYLMGKLAGLKRPMPEMLAIFSLFIIFDSTHTIWGINSLAVMAGEYSESMGLLFGLVYLGLLMRGIRQGRGMVLTSVFLALAVLSHPLVGVFATMGTVSALILEPRLRKIRWAAASFLLSSLFSSFWAIPFLLRREYTTEVGWTKDAIYSDYLFRGDWWWIFMLAVGGAVISFVMPIRLGRVFTLVGVGFLLLFRFFETGFFFTNRLIPFYYLSVVFLAALFVGVLVRKLFIRNAGPPLIEPQKKRARRIFKSASSVLLFFVILDVVPVLELGEKFVRYILRINPMAAAEFFNVMSRMTYIASFGLALAGLLLYSPQIKNWVKDSFRRRRGIDIKENRTRQRPGTVLLTLVMFLTLLTSLYAVDLHTRVLGFENSNSYGLNVPGLQRILTTESIASPIRGWSNWNYEGYEKKGSGGFGPGWEEYSGVIQTMQKVGSEYGCGRALWEYDNDRQTSYGSSFSRNLFGYWTDGCITAMDGLYTESAASSPFYYITLTEVSEQTSQIISGAQYPGRDFLSGIEHLRQLGVNYYIVATPRLVEEALARSDQLAYLDRYPDNPEDITELSERWSFSPYYIFLIKDSDTVEPLRHQPVVMGSDHWLERSNDWWLNGAGGGLEPVALANGPRELQRLEFLDNNRYPFNQVEARQLRDIQVSNVNISDKQISFSVDQIGVPVIVKVSYFPNWRVSGALGPYRATPNWMVVIPTQEEVKLTYAWTPVEYLGYGLSGLGIVAAVGIFVWNRRKKYQVLA